MRVGNVVTVSGEVSIDAPSTGQAAFYLTLPVASNLVASCQLAGSGVSEYGYVVGGNGVTSARVYGDSLNNRAIVEFYSPGNYAFSMSISFTYLIA